MLIIYFDSMFHFARHKCNSEHVVMSNQVLGNIKLLWQFNFLRMDNVVGPEGQKTLKYEGLEITGKNTWTGRDCSPPLRDGLN